MTSRLTPVIPLRRIKSSATDRTGRMIHVLECGHTQPVNTVADRDRESRRCYECWRAEPLPQ